MISFLVPCASPLWYEELKLAKLRDEDAVIRLDQQDPHHYLKRAKERHAYEGFIQGCIEATINGWRLVDTHSPGGWGVIYKDLSCDVLMGKALEWVNKAPNHRELVVAFVVPSRQDEFQRALRRHFLFIY